MTATLWRRAFVLGAGAILAGSFALATLSAIQFPLNLGDYGAIWGLKARTLFVSGDLTRVFMVDPGGEFSQPGYPVLWPYLLAAVASLLGRYDEYTLVFLRPVLLAIAALLLAKLTRASLPFRLLSASALCLFPYFLNPTYAGYAEALLVVFALAGRIFLSEGGDSARSGLAAGFVLALAALTKNEGVALSLVTALLLFLAGRRKQAALAAGLPLAAASAWWLVRLPYVSVAPLVGYSAGAFSLTKLILAASEIGRLFVWPNLAWIAGTGCVLALLPDVLRKRKGELFGAFAYLFVLFLAYGFTHFEPRWHVQNSWDRLLLIPMAAVVLPVLSEAASEALSALMADREDA
ncbi:MAG: hypothetical protein IT186_26525 [Acidobacteria bacterium]|nr:hypothetical protein [Acidobacteriota bacterium]MCG3194101.1 hypothetical protein [Thermoanaerobaculia bacterium]